VPTAYLIMNERTLLGTPLKRQAALASTQGARAACLLGCRLCAEQDLDGTPLVHCPVSRVCFGERQIEVEYSPSEAFATAATDSMFSCPGRAMNQALADKMPVYAYEFGDRTAPTYVGPTTFPLLAAHTYELSYLFPGFHGGGDAKVALNPLQEKLSDEMVDYFAHVAQLPSREDRWPRFNPAQDNVMALALPTATMTTGRFAQTHHCGFWDQAGVY
jgi:carboxylesterase type B